MFKIQKNKIAIRRTIGAALTVAFAGLVSFSATAGTLETLERERAQTITIMLNPELAPADRAQKLELAKLRLVDLERMVLRDKEVMSSHKATVKRAFANYDLTFMVHASVEKDRALVDHWLTEVGLSTDSVLGGRVGRRY